MAVGNSMQIFEDCLSGLRSLSPKERLAVITALVSMCAIESPDALITVAEISLQGVGPCIDAADASGLLRVEEVITPGSSLDGPESQFTAEWGALVAGVIKYAGTPENILSLSMTCIQTIGAHLTDRAMFLSFISDQCSKAAQTHQTGTLN